MRRIVWAFAMNDVEATVVPEGRDGREETEHFDAALAAGMIGSRRRVAARTMGLRTTSLRRGLPSTLRDPVDQAANSPGHNTTRPGDEDAE